MNSLNTTIRFLAIAAVPPLMLCLGISKVSAASISFGGTVLDSNGNFVTGTQVTATFSGKDLAGKSVTFGPLTDTTGSHGGFTLSNSIFNSVPIDDAITSVTIMVAGDGTFTRKVVRVEAPPNGAIFKEDLSEGPLVEPCRSALPKSSFIAFLKNSITSPFISPVEAAPISCTLTPEPSNSLGVLAFGAFAGTGLLLKHKQKKQTLKKLSSIN